MSQITFNQNAYSVNRPKDEPNVDLNIKFIKYQKHDKLKKLFLMRKIKRFILFYFRQRLRHAVVPRSVRYCNSNPMFTSQLLLWTCLFRTKLYDFNKISTTY